MSNCNEKKGEIILQKILVFKQIFISLLPLNSCRLLAQILLLWGKTSELMLAKGSAAEQNSANCFLTEFLVLLLV